MINIKFYRDREGYFKADSNAKYQLLSQYFESEVQGVAAICEELLATIKEIEMGDRSELEGIGNAHGLKITAENVILWNEFSNSELTLDISLVDFKQALKDCLKFCLT